MELPSIASSPAPASIPCREVEWDLRSAVIAGEDGRVVFEQRDVEVPRAWSQTADQRRRLEILSRAARRVRARETSVRQLIGRVVDTIAGWGESQSYFADDAARDTFNAELTSLLRHPERRLQQPGVLQRRDRSASRNARPASSSKSMTTWNRSWLVPQRGNDLQRRLGRGRQSLGAALVPREALGGRHRLGPAVAS